MKKNWLAILLIAIMSFFVFVACAPTETSSGSTGSSTGAGGGDDTTQAEAITGSGNIAPTFTADGVWKKADDTTVVLPKLNDTDYQYVEASDTATFTYPKTGDAIFTVSVAILDEIQVGNKTYNNVTCNFAGIENVTISYENESFTFAVAEGQEGTVNAVTGKDITVAGKGTLKTSSVTSTDLLRVKAGAKLSVANETAVPLTVKNAYFEAGSYVSVTSNASEGMVVNGNACAFGKMDVKDLNRSKDNNGVLTNGNTSAFKVNTTSEVTVDGYNYGITSTTGGRIYRPGSSSWSDVPELDEDGEQYRPNILPGKDDTKFPGNGTVFYLKVVYSNYRWNINEANT